MASAPAIQADVVEEWWDIQRLSDLTTPRPLMQCLYEMRSDASAAQIAQMRKESMHTDADVNKVVQSVREKIGDVFQVEWPGYSHMGATIVDSILQAGLNYRSVVEPRVVRVIQVWPDARTTSAFLDHIANYGLDPVLAPWTGDVKPDRIKALASFLKEHGIEDEAALRSWLENNPQARQLVLSISGVGNKTFDYISSLVGVETTAIDVHLRRFVVDAGVDATKGSYDQVQALLRDVADELQVSERSLDRAIWRYQALGLRGNEGDPTGQSSSEK
jgi:hypothetical protein